jgi:glycosyltransferase involved in cell wall biosynthesis
MPFLSILTPTWNRGDYLENVWRSLAEQTSGDFEWSVGADGSTDDTPEIVATLAAKSSFPVLYIRADRHVGKARIDNEAIRQARGEITVWCDSDDRMEPDAVRHLADTWITIPVEQRHRFVGMTALVATDEGTVADPFSGADMKDVSWNDLAEVHRVAGDMFYAARTSALRAHPFPEIDLVIPESVVWAQVGDAPARFMSKVLRRVEYRARNAISFSGTMSYNRGRARALAITRQMTARYRRPLVRRWRDLVTYLRWSLHGDVPLAEARSLWGTLDGSLPFWIALLPATGLAVLDRLRGKVVKTHREFLANRNASIVATYLNKAR